LGARLSAALFLVLLFSSPPALAQPLDDAVSIDAEGRVTIRATRASEPLRVDGTLSESIYESVDPITNFLQGEPNVGEPATEKTEAWLFFDDENLYVSARCWDSRPGSWIANEMRRDATQIRRNDSFGLILDTFHDRRNGFLFYVTPIGGLADEWVTDERTPNTDWNTIWDARTGRFENGWTVEMVIPFKSLRFAPGDAQVWGVNLRRIVRRKNEYSYPVRMPPAPNPLTAIFRVSSAATLVGLEVPSGGTRLELKPWAIGGLTTDLRSAPPRSNDGRRDAGVEAKYGVTENLTADFTYNTDFAQVEVDEEQVNLTRFSLQFPEKRDFFLEGRGIFDFGGANRTGASDTPVLFFSRRIGIEGSTEIPLNVGARLTGKAGAYSLGLLNIQTDDPEPEAFRETNFTVARLRRDVFGRSSIGAIFTNRSVSPLDGGSNQVYGVDGIFSFFGDLNINAYFARSRTRSIHRGDSSYRVQLDYNGDRYGLQIEQLAAGEGFNPEVGFMRRRDFRRSFGQLRVSRRPSEVAHLRRISLLANFEYLTDNDGLVETRQGQGQMTAELENSDQFVTTYTRYDEFLDRPFEVSSGASVPVGRYDFQDVNLSYTMGPQRRASATVALRLGSFYDGDIKAIEVSSGRVELSPQLSVEPTASLNWVDLAGGSFFTRVVRTRATYTFSPRMFLSGLLQFNSNTSALGSNIRLRWEYRPGSELFVVYNDERNTDVTGFPALRNRAFIMKFNRLFRF
jgi:hypothetical protein